MTSGRHTEVSKVGRVAGRVPRLSSGSEYADFLPGALSVSEQPPHIYAKLIVVLGAGLIASAFIWASLAHLDRIVTARGKVRPEGQVQIIDHPSGGTVAAIHVSSGNYVQKDEILVSLNATLIHDELRNAQIQRDTLQAEICRLNAEITGRSVIAFPKDLNDRAPSLVELQTQLLADRTASFAHQRQVLQSQLEMAESEETQQAVRLRNLKKSLDLAQQQESGILKLQAQGYFPKLRALQVQRDVTSIRSDVEQSQALLECANSARAAAIEKLGQLDRERQGQVRQEITVKSAKFAEAEAVLQQTTERLKQIDVRAPQAGTVEDLQISTIGQSIAPGQQLMRLVPEGSKLVVDVQLPNRDVGFVKKGMKATLKFLAYDYLRFGTIEGKVTSVAADSTANEKSNEFFYTVAVAPAQDTLGKDHTLKIQSGMLVDVDLHLGTRTALTYFIDAITRTTDKAFVE